MDLIMTYKIIYGLVDMDMNYFFTVNTNHIVHQGIYFQKFIFEINLVLLHIIKFCFFADDYVP